MNDLGRASTKPGREVLMRGGGQHEVGLPVAEGSHWNAEEEEAKGWPKIRLRVVSNGLENDPGYISNEFH